MHALMLSIQITKFRFHFTTTKTIALSIIMLIRVTHFMECMYM